MNSLAEDYTDSWRELHPKEANVFTVWDERTNARATNTGLRIDYTLCSRQLHNRVASCEVNLQLPQVRIPRCMLARSRCGMQAAVPRCRHRAGRCCAEVERPRARGAGLEGHARA